MRYHFCCTWGSGRVRVHENFYGRFIDDKLYCSVKTMKKEFNSFKRILEEHLTSINENTTEIQTLFDFLQELDMKVDRLSQRVEQAQLLQGQSIPKPAVSPLDQTERRIFLTLYTEEAPLSYQELSTKSGLPLSLIPENISSLVQKGIPFQRSLFNGTLFLKLDPAFKEQQAKENIVNLSLQSFME